MILARILLIWWVMCLAVHLPAQSSADSDVKNWIVRYANAQDANKIRKSSIVRDAQLIFPALNLWAIQSHLDLDKPSEKKKLPGEDAIIYVHKDLEASWRRIPNDPDYPSQWGLPMIDMEEVWDITTGGQAPNGDDIVVAIFDDGFQLDHIDLDAHVWKNDGEVEDNGIDDDMNGYIDDYWGWNATEDNDDHRVRRHGTSVAGIIGAESDNGTQVAGINWDVKLMFTSGGRSENVSLVDIVKAYNYVYTQRKLYNESGGMRGAYVVVTNYSGGAANLFPDDFPSWCEIYDMLGQEGVLNITSAPNTETDVDVEGDLPSTCQSEFLIVVTNTDQSDQKVQNAGYGAVSIDLGAPGEGIFTTGINDNTDPNFSGASASAPHVAGVISLLYTIICDEAYSQSIDQPELIARAMKSAIFDGAQFNESLLGITTTGGRLNALNSLEIIRNSLGNCCELYLDEFSLVPETCSDANDGQILALATGDMIRGQILYSIDGIRGNTEDTLAAYTRLDPGNYTLTIYDSDNSENCRLDTIALVEERFDICPFGEFKITGMSPNPASNILEVEYELDELKLVIFQIHDNLGRLVYENLLQPELLGRKIHAVDVRNFPQGTYFASIQANGIQETETFLIVR